ncbi:MAG: NAD(P)H-hydrate dehydratase [Oscillospiraceae bacterium]|nr:NAD(P)H-hydrate dehydratase [Oscillospiraceae bacterium]
MKKLFDSASVKAADAMAMKLGGLKETELVKRAAEALYKYVAERIIKTGSKKIAVVCGSYNNGADGYALSRLLCERKRELGFTGQAETYVIALDDPCSGAAIITAAEAKAAGCVIRAYSPSEGKRLAEADIIVDCILGTGTDTSRHIDERLKELIADINSSDALKISCDVPTGVSSDNGSVLTDINYNADENVNSAVCVKADETCSFILQKAGLAVTPGMLYAGKQAILDFDFPPEAVSLSGIRSYLVDDEAFNLLPTRNIYANKGTYGTLLSLCGSPDMPGASYMAAYAALRTGVGLVCAAADKYTLSILKQRVSEPVFIILPNMCVNQREAKLCSDALIKIKTKLTAVLCGCGIGMKGGIIDLITNLCDETEKNIPMILDADALNLLSADEYKDIKKAFFTKHGDRTIITPHPGEAARLLGIDTEKVNADRIGSARRLSEMTGGVAVLKGYRTVTAAPGGDVYINPTGNDGMAKGGSGDVLAGIIAGLAAQGTGLVRSAVTGVYIHGMCGDRAAEKLGKRFMLPTDMISCLSEILMLADKNLKE